MLESYITPLLMGYVNKYIKNLKPSDFSLSVWGGDVVLQNLELNLDVLQQEVSLPINFLSGRIHELQIHVPWTRITYEPVTIAINTIEFVVKLRDPDEVRSEPKSNEIDRANIREMKKEMQKAKAAREAEHLPPGYVQGVINKVINNISISISNLILKYVEDDIVLTLNVKSVALFSANESWEKAFVQLTLPSLCLRKICNISNLTICLDSRNADGKIEMYQDPILYKCNLTCRILSKYLGLGSVSAYESQINVYCESLDLSSTDVQLPMVIRLLKLCVGLYYRTLDLPGCNYKLHPAEEILEERRHLKHASETHQTEKNEQNGKFDESSWASWAWSMIPNLGDEGSQLHSEFHFTDEETILLLGVYVTQCSLTLKVTNEAHNSSIVGSKRFEFSPVLNIEMSGCAMEVISKGEEYFDCQFGVCNIVGYMIGDCLCKNKERNAYHVRSDASMSFDEVDREPEDELIFQLGTPKNTADSGVVFLEGSLFQQPINGSSKDTIPCKKTVLPEKGKQFIEGKVTKKFGAVFLDYFYLMELPQEITPGPDSRKSDAKEKDLIKETSTKRLIIGNLHVFINSKVSHMVTKIMEYCADDSPQRKMKDGVFIDKFVTNQLKLGNFSTRGLHVTFHALTFTIGYVDHFYGEPDACRSDEVFSGSDGLYGIIVEIDRVDYQATNPMFPNELNALLQSDVKPKAMFYRAAYSDFFAKFFGVQLGVCHYHHDSSEPTKIYIVPTTHASIYAKMFIAGRGLEESVKSEFRIKLPNLTASLSKAQLMLLTNIASSWTQRQSRVCLGGILDVFHRNADTGSSSLSVLETSLTGIDLKYLETDRLRALQGALASVKVRLRSFGKDVHGSKAVLYGPLHTSELGNVTALFDESKGILEEIHNEALLSFKVQVPLDPLQKALNEVCSVAKIDLKGMAAMVDDDLLKWFEYKPAMLPRKRDKTVEKRPSRAFSRSFSSSTPKRKSYARLHGNSPSKASKEQKKEKQGHEKVSTLQTKASDNQFSFAMALLKTMILKIDVEAFTMFLPVDPMTCGPDVSCLEYRIPFAFKRAFMDKAVKCPEALVITLPNISVSSSNLKSLDVSLDIPLKRAGDIPQESSLPWSLSGDGFSMYILSQDAIRPAPDVYLERLYIWYPAPWTVFLAAADADPKTPDDPKSPLPLLKGSMTKLGVKTFAETLPFEQSETECDYRPVLGFCIHIDLTLVAIGMSQKQAEIAIRLFSRLRKALDTVTAAKKDETVTSQWKSGFSHTDARSERSATNYGNADHHSISSMSTVDNEDVLSGSTDHSVLSSECESGSNNLKVSLWLQWIVPKISVTFYGEPSLNRKRPWYKIPCEIEDFSFAFDYQQGEIRMKSKIGSIIARNYFMRPGSTEWESDKFGGVLLSSDDVLTSTMKTLPTMQNSSPRCFLILNYTRQPLSGKSSRKRQNSVRAEATIANDNLEVPSKANEKPVKYVVIDVDMHQHMLDVTMQSLDILFIVEPVLAVLDSFKTISRSFDSTGSSFPKVTTSDKTGRQREGAFKLPPVLELESKGFRVIASLADDVQGDDKRFDENILIFSVQSVVVNSDPNNRISSTVLDKDWYRQIRKHNREKNRRTKLWHTQYQVDLNGLSAWSGDWGDIRSKRQANNLDMVINADGQNPALEWNYQMSIDNQPMKLTPLLQDFNCRATLSPALKIVMADSEKALNVCTASVEVNFSNDIAAFCNPFQVNLLSSLFSQTFAKLQDIAADRSACTTLNAAHVLVSPEVIDSGISSVMSLKGTNDLKSIPEPEHHDPEDIANSSSPMHLPVELFISGSKLSLSLYIPEVVRDEVFHEESRMYRLIGYAEIIQPTVDFRDNVLQVSLYDALVAYAKENTISNSLPDRGMYENTLVKTFKGKQNGMTGLFRSALTITACIKDSIKVSARVDRPLQVDVAVEIVTAMDLFASKLSKSVAISSQQPKPSTTVGVSNKSMEAFIIKEVGIKTNRITATLSIKFDMHDYSVTVALRAMDMLIGIRDEVGQLYCSAFNYKCELEGFEVYLGKDNKHCSMLSPCILSLNGELETIQSTELPAKCFFPRTVLFICSSLVQLKISQLHLEYITVMSNCAHEMLGISNSTEGSESAVRKASSDLESYVEYSRDDLKSHSFSYVVHHGNRVERALPNQIVFYDDENGRPPVMTWRYPVPRFLNEVVIMPIPFHVDEVMPGDESAEIPCVIRCWDHIEQSYVTCRNFFLSQSKSQTLSFPNPILNNEGESSVASEEWQIVVDVAIETDAEEKSEADSIPEDILREVTSVYKTPVSATALAACIKVNSCFVPSKIPRAMCSLNIGCLQTVLENHFSTSENVQPRLFAPFFLDSYTYPMNQEACRLELNGLQCKGSLSGDADIVQNITVEFDAALDVMNYKDLSWRNCLFASSFAAEFSLNSAKNSQNLDLTQSKIEVEVEAIKAVASQSVVHTLSMTEDNWKRDQVMDVDIPLLNHYIICNETEDFLRFGQVDTDEDILLASGQMYPYSWRSPHNRMLHLCIDSIGDWRWCAPFDIDSEKGCTRTIKHTTHCSVIDIDIKRIGGIQKQIIIRGGIYFRNCLKTDVEFELFLHHIELVGHLQQQKIKQVPKTFVVPAETTRPSMSFSPSTITTVYLRLISDTTQGSWSPSIAFSADEDLCLPLTLTFKDETFNVWYTVSRINTGQYSQIQLCICPFYVVRNHLSWTVVMTAKPRDEGESSNLMVLGRGKETEVSCLAPKTWYSVNFQLEGTNECTDPPVPINTTFLDILKKKGKMDLQSIDYSAEWPYKDTCSIPEEQPPRFMPQRSPKPIPETSSPDLQCQLLQRWENLPTIVIEIRPKFILLNCSQQDLVIRDADTHLIWDFGRNSVLTSPAIQASIQFGNIFDYKSGTQWSSEIYLSELKEASRYFVASERGSACLHPHTSISFNVFSPAKDKCLQFALTSKIRNDIIIVSVNERFCVHNFTGIKLNCFPTLCEVDVEEVNDADVSHINESSEPQMISNLCLIPKARCNSNPDLSKFSIGFFFYDTGSRPVPLSSSNAFNLSRDHLRENITLQRSNENPLCIAMTSYMKDGVIHIFLDKECYPSFVFCNRTSLKFTASVLLLEKEKEDKRGKSDVTDIWDSEIEVGPQQRVSHQCKSFRDNFPRIGTSVHGRLKLRMLGEDNGVTIKMFDVNEKDQTVEFSVSSDSVIISLKKAANCFYVSLSSNVSDILPVRSPINLPLLHISLKKIDVLVVDDMICEEIFDLSADKVLIKHSITERETSGKGLCCKGDSKFSLEIGALQIDNQSTDDYDHFPVVLLPLREVSQRYRGESPHNAPFGDAQADMTNPLLKAVATVYSSEGYGNFIDDLQLQAEPLEMYVEDSFIYRLVSLTESFCPPIQTCHDEKPEMRLVLIRSVGRQILHPINIGSIQIEELHILLSIHASMKMYLSADHMPVVLGKFICHSSRTIQKELTRKILYHYVTQALVRAGLMLGSLEILANPTGLFRSMGQGVADFFSLPYDGLTRGPSAFVSGISRGIGSFFRHASHGALTSVTNFASSLSRNMDRLSLDEQHMIRQEEQRCRTSSQVWSGFSNALSGFAVSLLGAVAGIVEHPITNIQNAETTHDAVTGAAKGFGKGLVGMVAKPIGGAMELVSQTSQGILLGTGLTKPPKKLKAALAKRDILRLDKESYMKYLWKVIRVEFDDCIPLFVITDVHICSASDRNGYNGTIILTPSAFYLFDSHANNIRMAFACNEINLRLEEDGHYIVYLEKRDKKHDDGYCYNQIENINNGSLQSSRESSKDSSSSHTTVDSNNAISMEMHPRYSSLLLSQFSYQRDLIEEKLNEEVLELVSFKQ